MLTEDDVDYIECAISFADSIVQELEDAAYFYLSAWLLICLFQLNVTIQNLRALLIWTASKLAELNAGNHWLRHPGKSSLRPIWYLIN